MYLKIVGVILMITGGGMIGMKKAETLMIREEYLRGLRESLVSFCGEIEYKTEKLENAMRKAAQKDVSGVFEKSIENIRKYGAVEGFLEASKNARDKQAREILFSFARGLDAEDKEGQIKNAHITIERMDEEIKAASEEKRKLSKMYVMTGFLLGAAVGIMFI